MGAAGHVPKLRRAKLHVRRPSWARVERQPEASAGRRRSRRVAAHNRSKLQPSTTGSTKDRSHEDMQPSLQNLCLTRSRCCEACGVASDCSHATDGIGGPSEFPPSHLIFQWVPLLVVWHNLYGYVSCQRYRCPIQACVFPPVLQTQGDGQPRIVFTAGRLRVLPKDHVP